MYPELFSIGDITIRTYGLMTLLGATLGYLYGVNTAHKELGIEKYKLRNLTVIIILSAFIGGKLFFFLEDPEFYFNSFDNIKRNFKTGYVFYGSLLFSIPTIVWYFRIQKWPFWPMMDILAIIACITHGTGRLGCFFNGCCHGTETDLPWAVIYSDPLCQAPLHTALHPTQLYAAALIFSILVLLLILKKRKKFAGRLFFIYIVLYAAGRSILEIFRGDVERGFVIDNVLSHSQFISIIIIAIAVMAYFKIKIDTAIHVKK